MNVPTHFKDELLSELRQVVAERPAPDRNPAPADTRSDDARLGGIAVRALRVPRTRLVLSGAGVAAASATAIVIASSGGVPSNAYAVDSHGNGSVTVHVRELSDAAGLQQSLRAAGVPATVTYAPTTKLPTCAAPTGVQTQTHESKGKRVGPGKQGSSTIVEGSSDSGPTFSTGSAAPFIPYASRVWGCSASNMSRLSHHPSIV